MSSDLPEKILDISLDEPGEREPTGPDDEDEAEYDRFFFFTVGHQRLAIEVDAVKTIIDAPETVTTVPRTPPSVEGVTDVRGEITAIVDPRAHFPTDEEPTDEERLLVFDRPADRQAAAMRVDGVDGVDAVPEDRVLDREAVESSEFDGHALEHPLVVALIERERTSVEANAGADSAHGPEDPPANRRGSPADEDGKSVAGGATAAAEAGATRTVVVEATPLVDVDRLLLASGRGSTGTPGEAA